MDKQQIMEDSKLLAFANNQLALNLQKILSQKGENVFFSPFSISIAMAMLLRGAKEETLEELMKVLGHESLSCDEVHRRFGDLFGLLSQNQGQYTLDVANAILSQKGFQLQPDYVEDLKNCYQALAIEVDFANDTTGALNLINGFVKEKTKKKIPKLLDRLSPETVTVLLNAVYFKGSWVVKFNLKATRPQEFFNKGAKESAKDVPMMFKKDKFLYVDRGEYKALELPYEGNDIAMMILLPKELFGVVELEKSLEVDFIANLRNKMHKIEVYVTLPKFHMEYSEELIPVFKELGLRRVFDHRIANLKGLSDSDQLEVSVIKHKAVLDVNEEGSEAAAATAVVIKGRCYQSVIDFQVDHPFLFVIYNKMNDMILFIGRVNEL